MRTRFPDSEQKMQQDRQSTQTMLMGRYRVLGASRALRSSCGRAIDTKESKQPQVFFKSPDVGKKVETEARELRRAASETQGISNIRPIRVIDADLNSCVLITELVPNAKSLFNLLWDETGLFAFTRSRRIALPEIAGLLGRWLGAYSAASAITPVDVEENPIAMLVRTGIGRMRSITTLTSGRGLEPSVIARLTRELQDIGNDLQTSGTTQTTQIHGDLNLSNVLVAPDGNVFLIDFADTRPGLGLEDFVNVWHTLWSLSHVSRRRKTRIEPCLDRLVDGFSRNGEAIVDTLEFQLLLRVRAIIQVLVGASTAKRFGQFGMRSNRRLAAINRRWLEEGCPTERR